jgi:CSLREA domain-containing protein
MSARGWGRAGVGLVLVVRGLVGPARPVQAATFTVDTLADTVDVRPGDGVCADAGGRCSLRAAVMEANALGGGPHTIVLGAGQTYTLSRDADGGGHAVDSGADNDDLDITANITIQGNGATIQRDPSLGCTFDENPRTGEFRIFEVKNGATLSLQDVVVTNGCADGDTLDLSNSTGGAVLVQGELNLVRTKIRGNRSASVGSGIRVVSGGRATIVGSTLSENRGCLRRTGCFSNNGMVIITESTLAGNSDPAISNGGTLVITNSTLSGNGGGIENFGGSVRVAFVTVTNNTGSGIYNSGAFNIKNSIVANNTVAGRPVDCGGALNAFGVNFATDTTCAGFRQVTSAQLNLQPLADNGGPTPTHALGPGSVAIDAVSDCTDLNNTPVRTDQRGVARPQGVRCDAGAFEREGVRRLYLPLVVRGR